MAMSLRVVLRMPPTTAASPTADDDATTVASLTTSSADEDASDDPMHRTPRLPKKRKSSYHTRKDEMCELRQQEQTLLAQLRAIQDGATTDDDTRSSLIQAQRETDRLRSRVAANWRAIAGARAITSGFGSQLEVPPLGDYIHLPRDPVERRNLLHSLKPRKLDDAVRFLLARAQSQNLRRRTRQLETFETETGDHVVLDWGVATLTQPGLTVKMVYDELLAFAQTHEMTLADKLGVIAVRESDICAEVLDVTEVRVVSSCPGTTLLIEKNIAAFTQYVERSELLDEPHGVLLFDFVDQDDCYPYQPLTRIRKDISAATLVMQCPPVASVDDASDEQLPPTVAVVKYSYGRIPKSPLASDDERAAIAREGAFFDVMIQTVREQLAWKAS